MYEVNPFSKPCHRRCTSYMQVYCQKASQTIEIHGYADDHAIKRSFYSGSTTLAKEDVNVMKTH